MEVMTFLIVSLSIFVLLELVEFRVDFLEKRGVKSFFTSTLVSVTAAFVICMLDGILLK